LRNAGICSMLRGACVNAAMRSSTSRISWKRSTSSPIGSWCYCDGRGRNRNASANSPRRLTDLMVGRELAAIDCGPRLRTARSRVQGAAALGDDDRAAYPTRGFWTASLSNSMPARF
jgi:hypothetical protein